MALLTDLSIYATSCVMMYMPTHSVAKLLPACQKGVHVSLQPNSRDVLHPMGNLAVCKQLAFRYPLLRQALEAS